MKKILKNWNWFEIVFLIVSYIVLTLCFALGTEKNTFSFIVSLVGVSSVMLVAKGLTIAPIVSIVYNILYAILSITQKYYGETIIYTVIMIPLSIISIVSWVKNKNGGKKEQVQVNKISKKEYLILSFVIVVVTFGFYFLLKALHTNELIVSTISLVAPVISAYLMLRRSSNYAICFIVSNVVLIVLWGLSVKTAGAGFLPTICSFVIFTILDVYGLIHWKKEEKRQDEESLIVEKSVEEDKPV